MDATRPHAVVEPAEPEADARRPRRGLGRRLFEGFAWVLVLGAVLCLGYELWGFARTGSYQVLTAGELWYRFDAAGLNLLQAIVQRYLSPALWDSVIVTLLLRPAWLLFGLPGLSALVLARLRRKRSP